MKIIPKLTLAVVGGMCVVLGVNGYVRVNRETTTFELQRVARHRRVALALSAAMSAAWKREGRETALEIMDGVAAAYPPMTVRWRPVEAMGTEGHPHPPATGEPYTTIDRATEPDTRFTWVAVTVDKATIGEVELSEQMTADREHARDVLVETTKTAAFLAALSALIAFILGQWVVGKPVRALAEKARRIGSGDFGEPLALDAADELAQLAREMNAMADRLGGTLEQLRHADRLATVGKLAAGVAHELGTPLNVVSARAEMIAAGRTTQDESREYARVIGTAVDRMTGTISQLLHFARRKTIARSPQDVGALVGGAVELLRPLARKKNVEVDVETTPLEASVDAGQLQQVVTNLVMNAIHASNDGDRIEVRVEACSEAPPVDVGGPPAEGVRIVVRDEGSGITDDDLPRIFEPFFTTKDVGEGTGLGLAVSYGIVREHQGWMNVKSTVGHGSTFTVVLPGGESK